MPTGLKAAWEVQARGGLNRGSPASERGDCTWPNEGARGIRSAGVTTAATCWAVTCERQWPLWHGNCCSGVSGAEPWSRFIATVGALALAKPKSHPAQCISETSRPSVSNRTNGSRPSRLPVPAPATVTPTCIIVLPVNSSSGVFKALYIKQHGQERGHKGRRGRSRGLSDDLSEGNRESRVASVSRLTQSKQGSVI